MNTNPEQEPPNNHEASADEGIKILRRVFPTTEMDEGTPPKESKMREKTLAEEGSRKRGDTLSKRAVGRIFHKDELLGLTRKKFDVEGDRAGGALDRTDIKLRRKLEAIKWEVEDNRLGEVEVSGGTIPLPSSEELAQKHRLGDTPGIKTPLAEEREGGLKVLDEMPKEVIRDATRRDRTKPSKATLLFSLRDLVDEENLDKQNKIFGAVNGEKSISIEEIRDRLFELIRAYPDRAVLYRYFRKYANERFIGELDELLNGDRLPFNEKTKIVRGNIVNILGDIKSPEVINILENFFNKIRFGDFPELTEYHGAKVVPVEKWKVLHYTETINSLARLKEQFIDVPDVLDKIKTLMAEAEAIRGEADEVYKIWKEQNPGYSEVSTFSVPQEHNYVNLEQLRAEIDRWVEKYGGLKDEDKKFFIANLRKKAELPDIAEEILRKIEKDPGNSALYELFSHFQKTMSGDQTERLGAILLNDRVALDPAKHAIRQQLMGLLPGRGSYKAVKILADFVEKVKGCYYENPVEGVDGRPIYLPKKDQEIALTALGELDQRMVNSSNDQEFIDNLTDQILRLREVINNNIENAEYNYQQWRKNHPEYHSAS